MATELEKEEKARRLGSRSAIVEALAGALAVVLSILGLVGVLPNLMAQVSAIVLGGAILLEGSALSAHHAAARHALEGGREVGVGSGVSAEFIAGASGVVLGILALTGVQPQVLIPVAAIVLGSGLLFGGGLVAGTLEVSGRPSESRREHRVGRAAAGLGSAEALVGAGAVVLGILALVGVGVGYLTLSLVAFLALGAGVLLGGTALAGRLGVLARRDRERDRLDHAGMYDHTLRET